TGGALVLPSSTMTIADLLATSTLARGSTVHLSACDTAVRTGAMYSLAGGLLQLGARIVIGTLWAIADRDARHSSDVLYQALVRGDPWEAALATAVRALRDNVGDEHIERWAPFVAMLC